MDDDRIRLVLPLLQLLVSRGGEMPLGEITEQHTPALAVALDEPALIEFRALGEVTWVYLTRRGLAAEAWHALAKAGGAADSAAPPVLASGERPVEPSAVHAEEPAITGRACEPEATGEGCNSIQKPVDALKARNPFEALALLAQDIMNDEIAAWGRMGDLAPEPRGERLQRVENLAAACVKFGHQAGLDLKLVEERVEEVATACGEIMSYGMKNRTCRSEPAPFASDAEWQEYDKAWEPMDARVNKVTKAVNSLLRLTAVLDTGTAGKEPAPAEPAPPAPPAQYLFSWREILDALGLRNNEENQGRVRTLSDKYGGPIVPAKRGGQPRVNKAKLIEWWNHLEVVWQTEGCGHNKAASTEGRHPYGRDETVVPEISGHVKKRRRKNSDQ
jgi:hypothetical protein